MQGNTNNDQSSKAMQQLAEYRKLQAEKYKKMNQTEDQEDESMYNTEAAPETMYRREEPPVMQYSPPPPPLIDNMDMGMQPMLSDYDLAKQMQDEENQRFSEDNHERSINGEKEYNNQGNPDGGIRPPDNFRQERLIADPMEEEMEQQEFIRQQQILYAQYNNGPVGQNIEMNQNRPMNQPVPNNFGAGFAADAGAPLLQNRGEVNHMNIPMVGRVHREV